MMDVKEQALRNFESAMRSYLLHRHDFCGENRFDISDMEERLEFLKQIQWNTAEEDKIRKTVALARYEMLLALDDNLSTCKNTINESPTLLLSFLRTKIAELDDEKQKDLIYKNVKYIECMCKNEMMIEEKLSNWPKLDLGIANKIKESTLATIWNKLSKSLDECDNATQFRDRIIKKIEENRGEEECKKIRENISNEQKKLLDELAKCEMAFGINNRPIEKNNLNMNKETPKK